MSLYLADTLAGTCGLVDEAHLAYVRGRISGHPSAGASCKTTALQKIDALCLAGMLTDDLLEAILREFENNYATGLCNTSSGGSTGTTNQPQCPAGYRYDPVRSLCVEERTSTQAASDWFSDNWPWLALAGLGIVFFITTPRRKR